MFISREFSSSFQYIQKFLHFNILFLGFMKFFPLTKYIPLFLIPLPALFIFLYYYFIMVWNHSFSIYAKFPKNWSKKCVCVKWMISFLAVTLTSSGWVLSGLLTNGEVKECFLSPSLVKKSSKYVQITLNVLKLLLI